MPTNEQRRQNAKRKLERQLERRAERARKRRQLAVTASVVAVVLVVGVAAVLFVTLRGGDETTQVADAGATPTDTPAGLCTFAPDGTEPSNPATPPTETDPPTTGEVPATITTSEGVVPVTLDRATGPCAVESFVSLASQSYFDDTPCHRLTTSGIFVLQCGDPTGSGTGGPGYTINDEPPTDLAPATGAAAGSGAVVYPRGTLAMAKTAAPDSGGSQFFLVYQDSPLPPDYTVFGTIAPEGLTVLDQVADAGVEGGGADGAPATPVQLETVTTQA